ncbi:MAG: phenylalanine--tRNA ligase subunit beta, partial [Flavobacteriaceae bacterium]
HGLNTDASFRFERGIDIDNVEYCLKRAALLIKEIAGGDITSDIIDLYPKKKKDFEVFLAFDKIYRLIGQEIPKDMIKSILASLEIKVKNVTESGMGLVVPSYRVDVQRQVDVIEEILRVYGYNNIEFKTKLNASIATASKFDDYKIQNVIGDLLASQGFYEIMTNSLTSPAYNELLEGDQGHAVTMLNPLSLDLSVMRQSLLFTGLETVSYNINRKKSDLKFFEFGNTYQVLNNERVECKQLALYTTGNRNNDNWSQQEKKTDFYFLKAMVQNVLARLGIKDTDAVPLIDPLFSEGIILQSNDKEMVRFGVIKKKVTKHFDIKQEVLYAQFSWDNLTALAKKGIIVFKSLPKYPEVRRDLALLIDQKVSFDEIYKMAYQTEKKFLKNISLFDVYTGNNLPEGKKSYAVSFILQDENGTLTDKQIDKIMNTLQQRFEKELGAELR